MDWEEVQEWAIKRQAEFIVNDGNWDTRSPNFKSIKGSKLS